MAFLDPPPPEHLPRGVVTWPLLAAAALGHVPHALATEPSDARGIGAFAVAAQLVTLAIAAYTTQRLFATGAMRSRVIRIIALAFLAAASAAFTAATAHGAVLRGLELVAVVLALSIAARAVVGFRRAV